MTVLQLQVQMQDSLEILTFCCSGLRNTARAALRVLLLRRVLIYNVTVQGSVLA